MNNYLGTPLENLTEDSTRTFFNPETKQLEERHYKYIVHSVNQDGTLVMDRVKETVKYNGKEYAVDYNGPQRNF